VVELDSIVQRPGLAPAPQKRKKIFAGTIEQGKGIRGNIVGHWRIWGDDWTFWMEIRETANYEDYRVPCDGEVNPRR